MSLDGNGSANSVRGRPLTGPYECQRALAGLLMLFKLIRHRNVLRRQRFSPTVFARGL